MPAKPKDKVSHDEIFFSFVATGLAFHPYFTRNRLQSTVSFQRENFDAIYRSSLILLTRWLLVSSADNVCKQFGTRSGPTIRRA